jgi:hypothetical protein
MSVSTNIKLCNIANETYHEYIPSDIPCRIRGYCYRGAQIFDPGIVRSQEPYRERCMTHRQYTTFPVQSITVLANQIL